MRRLRALVLRSVAIYLAGVLGCASPTGLPFSLDGQCSFRSIGFRPR